MSLTETATNAAVDKAIEAAKPAMETFIGKLNGAIDIVSDQIIKNGPEVAEKLVSIFQLKAAANLGFSVLICTLLVFLIFNIYNRVMKPVFPEMRKGRHEAAMPEEEQGLRVVGGAIVCGVFGLIFAHWLLLGVFSFEDWLTVYDPVAGLAYKAIVAAGINI